MPAKNTAKKVQPRPQAHGKGSEHRGKKNTEGHKPPKAKTASNGATKPGGSTVGRSKQSMAGAGEEQGKPKSTAGGQKATAGQSATARRSHRGEEPRHHPGAPRQGPRPGGAAGPGQQQARARAGGSHGSNGARAKSAPESGGAKAGVGSRLAGSIKQHPVATAAIGTGVGLLLVEGVRRALVGGADSRSRDQGESEPPSRQSEGEQDSSSEETDSESEDDEDDDRQAQEERDDEDQGAHEPSFAADEAPGGHGERDAGEQEEPEGDDRGPGEVLRTRAAVVGRPAAEGISRLGSAVEGGASAIGHAAQDGYQRGKEMGGRGVANHPLVLCAVSLAAGAALGLWLPATSLEDQIMGKTSDRVAGKLKGSSQDLIGQGRKLIGMAVNEAVRATAREAEKEGLTPKRLGRKIKRVVGNVREAVAVTISLD